MVESNKKNLRSFGLVLGLILIILGLRLIFKYPGGVVCYWFMTAGAFFTVFSLTIPSILKPVYLGWMRIAHVIGWLNTKILLTLTFYLVVTPIGLCMKVLGRDLAGLKIDKRKGSYWIKRNRQALDPKQYEKQF